MYPPQFYILTLCIIGLLIAVPQLIASFKRWNSAHNGKR